MNVWLTESAAWLLTYLVHSTVLIGGVWALCRWAPIRSNALREWLWTVALFGGLLTAGFQIALDVKPIAGTIHLPSAFSASESALDSTNGRRPAHVASVSVLVLGPGADLSGGGGTTATATLRLLEAEAAPLGVQAGSQALAAFMVLGLAALLLAAYAFVVRLVRAPRRRTLREGPLPALLTRLRARAGMKRDVVLSVSEQVISPVAMGIRRPEICVPVRALTELNRDQMEALLAHELAHLIRRDPARLLLARTVEWLFFLQPLNRLARRRLFETVECRCDAFAIRQVGTGLPLAECLAEVAGWIADRRSPTTALAMAQPGSHLTQRVLRLLKEDDALARDRGRRGVAPFLSLCLPLLVFLSPVVATRGVEHSPVAFPTGPPAPSAVAVPPVAVALAEWEPSLSLRIVEAVGLLEQELDSLTGEVGALGALLRGQSVSPALQNRLTRLQSRMAGLNRRRQALSIWKNRMLRESGLGSSRPAKLSSGPLSRTRSRTR